MDPYQILGVARGCTRDEVKEAFRARAWHAHPDRGGDEQPFIELCGAYKQILAELVQAPRMGSFKRRNASGDARGRKPARPGNRGGRPAGQPEPVDRPPSPPRPDWEPDLVLDGEGRSVAPSKPADPDWEPELILVDEPPELPDEAPPAPGDLERGYASWIRRFSDRAARGESFWESSLAQSIGMLILVAFLAANLWLCWAVWVPDPNDEALPAEPQTATAK